MKEKLLEVLQQFDEQTLALAYVYAYDLKFYGLDITDKWVTATEQHNVLRDAYYKGYYDALKERVNENHN